MFSLVHYGFYLLVWVVKKGLTALGVLLTEQFFFYLSTVPKITLPLVVNFQSDALHDLVPFVQFTKHEKQP